MGGSAKILVVDDMPSNLEVVTETLVSQGYTITVATSGERALKQIPIHRPDLILLDVQMPGIDGFETCRRIKAAPNTMHIPIIFLTALSDSDSIVKGLSLGAVDYIGKPFQESVLLARVNTHIKLQALNQTLEKQVAERTCELETTTVQLQDALHKLQVSHLQLVQQEKMSALGNMVVGVAHEINNPLGFVSGNISELQLSFNDVTDCLKAYRDQFPHPGDTIQDLLKFTDIDFVLDDVPKMLESMQAGCDRIRGISNSLRIFSRADTESKIKANIHKGLDSTLLILKYRLKAQDFRPAIQVICNYGDIPEINCFPGQLNQVFMNLLANAIDMFDEVAEGQERKTLEAHPQTITIQTQLLKDNVLEICICDNGKGMSEEVCAKIFDRTFTTKKVGKGTGLGLAIAHQVIVEKHGGRLDVHSSIGKGTEFIIHLPV